MNKTLCLYQEDPYLAHCESTVLSVISQAHIYLLLDKSIFFPEGGGQPSDTGLISGDFGDLHVDYVFEKDGIIYHQIGQDEKPAVIDPKAIEGKSVSCHLDWPRRFTNMQRHCGEHILSSAFFELYGAVNRGFHMGDDYMTIDISLEGMPNFTQMTDEMIQRAEWKSNQMIWDNLPVTVRRFETREEAAKQPMRKALSIEDDIVLVCVGDESNAAGCVACCGTHPRKTGEVGLIKVYRWENYKGMARITFDAGPLALNNYIEESALVRNLNMRYSSDTKNLWENILAKEEKAARVRKDLYAIKQAHLADKAREINDLSVSCDCSVISMKYDILKTDDLLNVGKMIKPIPGKLIVLVSTKENTLILLSDGKPDCNKIIKDNAGVWKGKGGGRSNSARAMFPSEEDLECFVDYLRQAH